jgi:hypothetical protein
MSRVFVIMKGGGIQNVMATEEGVDVVVIDYDTDGCDEKEMAEATFVPQEGPGESINAFTQAFVSRWSPEGMRAPFGPLSLMADVMFGPEPFS